MLHTTMATTATSRDTYSLIRLVGSVFFFAPLQSVRHFVRVYTSVCVRVCVCPSEGCFAMENCLFEAF